MYSKNDHKFRDDKIAHLYKTRDWADCMFVFKNEKISAHKLILTCCSPVFESMFYGSMASAKIEISDIEADDFKQMLEFIYTNTVTFKSVINAWSLLYISQKYFLNDLKSLCVDYINFNLTLSTLLLSYEYAELYNLRQLQDHCWKDILLSANEVLQLDYHMQASTFCSLLDQNYISASEKDLIEAALKWSEEECVFQNEEITMENKLKMLIRVGIFSRLRFSCLGKSSYPYLCQLLDNNCQNIDYVSLLNPSTELRQRVPHHFKYKFRETYKIEQNIKLFETTEFNCIVTSAHKIVIYGIAVTPPHQGGLILAHSNVVISIFDKLGNIFYEIGARIKVTSDYEHPYLINFLRSVTFESGIAYKISVQYSIASNSGKPNELLCFYVSSTIRPYSNSMKIVFNDQTCGGVVRGLSFYVV